MHKVKITEGQRRFMANNSGGDFGRFASQFAVRSANEAYATVRHESNATLRQVAEELCEYVGDCNKIPQSPAGKRVVEVLDSQGHTGYSYYFTSSTLLQTMLDKRPNLQYDGLRMINPAVFTLHVR